MSFRTRLALVAAAAVALAVVVASFAVYFIVKGQLYGSVDDSLRRSATLVQNVDPHEIPRFTSPQFRAIGGVTQVVSSNGATFPQVQILPVPAEVAAVAKGTRDEVFFDTHALGQHLRVLAVQYPAPGVAIEVARSLTDTNHALSRIKLFLFLIAGFGIAVAAGLGLVVSRAALAPVRRLTQTAEEVSETRDLSRRIDVHGRDELSRLASTFNTMLAGLEDSARAQRQLVSDASHELRTPLTSLRTNIEVLAGENALPPEERERLMRDVSEQLIEMSALVAELVEFARGDEHPQEAEDVRLDLVAAEAIDRTRRNRPGVTFNPHLDESLRPRGPRHDRARRFEPARQRGEVEPARRSGGRRRARRRVRRPRPRPRDRGRGRSLHLRPLLSRAVGAQHARLGSRSCDRAAGRGRARRHDHRRDAGRRGNPDAPQAAVRERLGTGA